MLHAKGGTLFIREIGRLSPQAQQLLLGFIETGSLRLPGAVRPTRLDVRLIASSSIRLVELARRGEIDARLFDRLNVLPIFLPPLRQRREDIAPLARRFLIRHAADTGRRVLDIAPAALQLLAANDWPENVRELEATMRRAVAFAGSAILAVEDFPELLAAPEDGRTSRKPERKPGHASEPVQVDRVIPSPKQMEGLAILSDRFLTPAGEVVGLAEVERELIMFALGRHGGQMSRLARTLGIGRSTLYRKLRELGLDGDADEGVAVEQPQASAKRFATG